MVDYSCVSTSGEVSRKPSNLSLFRFILFALNSILSHSAVSLLNFKQMKRFVRAILSFSLMLRRSYQLDSNLYQITFFLDGYSLTCQMVV
jgi:hypothetical protein